jgi:hypothetical protein
LINPIISNSLISTIQCYDQGLLNNVCSNSNCIDPVAYPSGDALLFLLKVQQFTPSSTVLEWMIPGVGELMRPSFMIESSFDSNNWYTMESSIVVSKFLTRFNFRWIGEKFEGERGVWNPDFSMLYLNCFFTLAPSLVFFEQCSQIFQTEQGVEDFR